MLIRKRQEWQLPESDVTPESVFLNRRQLLASFGFLGMEGLLHAAGMNPYPAKSNPAFDKQHMDRPVTDEWAITGYNNFYEFTTDKENVKNRVGKFDVSNWSFQVTGLVNKPQKFDVDQLIKTMPLEERIYRHRCVEAWSMVAPWTGFPFSELIKQVDPKPQAKFIRFTSVNKRDQQPGIMEQPWYPWPYIEALRMDEAMNPLCLMVTGLYGKPLPKQNGAPIRIVCPWKYGFKSPKSIVKIEFVADKPDTFWNKLQPAEYGWYSNVNPTKSHPRWSQAIEREIPRMERKQTLMYNGYEQYVSKLYNGKED